MVTIRSDLCVARHGMMLYCASLTGEDLSRCLNKIKSAGTKFVFLSLYNFCVSCFTLCDVFYLCQFICIAHVS